MYMYESSQISNQTIHIASKVLETGAKIGGEIAKTVLLTALEKVKETKENKTGLTTLKNLLKSKEELGVIKINKDNLQEFKEKAKSLGIAFASIGSQDSNEVKIMYKTRQTNQVKECLMEMLEHEKANKLDEIQENNTMNYQNKNNESANKLDDIQEKEAYDSINKHLDFPGVYDGYTRHKISNINNEKATALSELLKKQGVENDIIVLSVNNNNTFNVSFRFKEKDKQKAIGIIADNKYKSIGELNKLIGEPRKESLESQINKAEKIGKEKAAEKSKIANKVKEVIER